MNLLLTFSQPWRFAGESGAVQFISSLAMAKKKRGQATSQEGNSGSKSSQNHLRSDGSRSAASPSNPRTEISGEELVIPPSHLVHPSAGRIPRRDLEVLEAIILTEMIKLPWLLMAMEQ